MSPGITVLPPASIVRAPPAAGAPADTDDDLAAAHDDVAAVDDFAGSVEDPAVGDDEVLGVRGRRQDERRGRDTTQRESTDVLIV